MSDKWSPGPEDAALAWRAEVIRLKDELAAWKQATGCGHLPLEKAKEVMGIAALGSVEVAADNARLREEVERLEKDNRDLRKLGEKYLAEEAEAVTGCSGVAVLAAAKELTAVIFRDGGQHAEDVGLDLALTQAQASVTALMESEAELEATTQVADQQRRRAKDAEAELARVKGERAAVVALHDSGCEMLAKAEEQLAAARAELERLKRPAREEAVFCSAHQEPCHTCYYVLKTRAEQAEAKLGRAVEALAKRLPCTSVSKDGFRCSGNATCRYGGKHNHGRRDGDWLTEYQDHEATEAMLEKEIARALASKGEDNHD